MSGPVRNLPDPNQVDREKGEQSNMVPVDPIVCPLSKKPLEADGDVLVSPAGFTYPQGDFRVPLSFAAEWEEGQEAYEAWDREWLRSLDRAPERMKAVDAEVAPLYDAIPLHGDVLDVGGQFGTVITQARLDPARVTCVDPLLFDFEELSAAFPSYAAHYRRIGNALHLRAFAEFLPLDERTFDTVHIRSALDHFASPTLALLEAYRVLRPSGSVVIGMSLKGAYKLERDEWDRPASWAKRRYVTVVTALKQRPRLFALLSQAQYKLSRRRDLHTFHPTRQDLHVLLGATGFDVAEEVWQAGYHNVLYLRATRKSEHPVQAGLADS